MSQDASAPRHALSNPYMLLTLAPLFWGGNAVVGKLAANEFTAIGFTFFRWLLTVLIVAFLARPYLRRDWSVIRQYWLRLVLMGWVGFIGFNLSLYGALHYTTAVNVAIEQAAIPVIIMLINGLVFRQAVYGWQIVGVVIAIVGVLFTVTQGQPLSILEGDLNRGDAIMLIGVLCYALYTVSLRWRPVMHDFSFLLVLSIGSLAFMTPLMLWDMQHHGLPEWQWSAFLMVLYVAIFPSFLAQLFYARGIALVGGNRGGVFINLVPIFGALLAVLVIGETFQFYHWLGLGLVLLGIGVAEWVVRRHNTIN